MLTLAFVRECFDYNPITGAFTWCVRPDSHFPKPGFANAWNAKFSGKQAGSVSPITGYMHVTIKNRTYLLHRIIWFWIFGIWPKQVDHKNKIKTDHAIHNLRDCTSLSNHRNKNTPKNNRSGFKGVEFVKRQNKWRARVSVNYQRKFLGLFDTFQEAVDCRKQYDMGAMTA